MPFTLQRGDITQIRADALVNAANPSLARGDGVCDAIYAAAGVDALQAACGKIGGCATGQAVITPGFGLAAAHIIHTVGPVWRGGCAGEPAQLYACYQNSLALARQNGCGSIAFPLISSGIYGYPKAQALAVATAAIRDFLQQNDMDVTLVIFDKTAVSLSRALNDALRAFIDSRYIDAAHTTAPECDTQVSASPKRPAQVTLSPDLPARAASPELPVQATAAFTAPYEADEPLRREAKRRAPAHVFSSLPMATPCDAALLCDTATPRDAYPPPGDMASLCDTAPPCDAASLCGLTSLCDVTPLRDASPPYDTASPGGLDDLFSRMEESFSSRLLRMIDERGRTDAEVYKRANIDRRVFSKIRTGHDYRPSKNTALAFAVALELSPDDTRDLLMTAGYALSRSNKQDLIVEYFITEKNFNIFEINEALFAFGQTLLGA